ncbi:hypothetical protein Mmc1_2221 [Magnetococcus marinus MC-1]|uniref:Uncharacterized protein n=1 Tax=Magnetococcus marinus (strain ATCC BAA-1437 / JCM 17883 / MC-1) TaxID=156889 RepID=A0L9S9_MAGMM|nr:hypothetical protein [Magnetococcus marinus]ABK44722.1 hypothetical protein Mmc1_2221 [Magnetococcus marinus MC-1]
MLGNHAPLLITDQGDFSLRLQRSMHALHKPVTLSSWAEVIQEPASYTDRWLLLHNPPSALPEPLLKHASHTLILLDHANPEQQLAWHKQGFTRLLGDAQDPAFPPLLAYHLSQIKPIN